MIIKKLKAVNVKRIKDVELIPPEDSYLLVIGGKNKQGKSSILDGIWMALGGGAAIPERPIRDGEDKASMCLDLGDYTVTRTWTKKGSAVEVANKDGLLVPRPQSFLDAIVGNLTFDPSKFYGMQPKDQFETVRKVVGIDFTQLDTERSAALLMKKEATDAFNRASANAEKIPSDVKEAPDSEVSVAALSKEHAEAIERNATNKKVEEVLCSVQNENFRIQAELVTAMAEVARLEKVLADLDEKEEKLLVDVGALEYADIPAIQAKIDSAESINIKVRLKAKLNEYRQEITESSGDIADATARILEIDTSKKAQVAAAKFPVEGLGFMDDGTGLSYNGVPLTQASQSERLSVAVGMGIALNKKVKIILIRDASLFDDDAMAAMEKIAAETQTQFWCERVGKSGDVDINWIIEDGSVIGEYHASA